MTFEDNRHTHIRLAARYAKTVAAGLVPTYDPLEWELIDGEYRVTRALVGSTSNPLIPHTLFVETNTEGVERIICDCRAGQKEKDCCHQAVFARFRYDLHLRFINAEKIAWIRFVQLTDKKEIARMRRVWNFTMPESLRVGRENRRTRGRAKQRGTRNIHSYPGASFEAASSVL